MRSFVLKRDGERCTVAEFDSYPCSGGPLHVHEVDHAADAYDPSNYSTACPAHHARWHALRRAGALRPHPVRRRAYPRAA